MTEVNVSVGVDIVEPHLMGSVRQDAGRQLSCEAFRPYGELLREAPFVCGPDGTADDYRLRVDAIHSMGQPVVSRDINVRVPDGNVVTFEVSHGLPGVPFLVALVGGGLPIASLSYPVGAEWSRDRITLRAVVGGMQDWHRKVVLRVVGIETA